MTFPATPILAPTAMLTTEHSILLSDVSDAVGDRPDAGQLERLAFAVHAARYAVDRGWHASELLAGTGVTWDEYVQLVALYTEVDLPPVFSEFHMAMGYSAVRWLNTRGHCAEGLQITLRPGGLHVDYADKPLDAFNGLPVSYVLEDLSGSGRDESDADLHAKVQIVLHAVLADWALQRGYPAHSGLADRVEMILDSGPWGTTVPDDLRELAEQAAVWLVGQGHVVAGQRIVLDSEGLWIVGQQVPVTA